MITSTDRLFQASSSHRKCARSSAVIQWPEVVIDNNRTQFAGRQVHTVMPSKLFIRQLTPFLTPACINRNIQIVSMPIAVLLVLNFYCRSDIRKSAALQRSFWVTGRGSKGLVIHQLCAWMAQSDVRSSCGLFIFSNPCHKLIKYRVGLLTAAGLSGMQKEDNPVFFTILLQLYAAHQTPPT